MKTAILATTSQGRSLAERIHKELADSDILDPSQGVRRTLEQAWPSYDGIICVMAAGIVVRCIAGLCRSKYSDPCVAVIDEAGRFAISLLSGHIGGGNALAEKIAQICGGVPVITTASDVSGHTAVDLWSVAENLSVVNPEKLASTSARLLDHGSLTVFQEDSFVKRFPDDFRPCAKPQDADIVIALRPDDAEALQLVPRIRFIGFGCRRGASVAEFEEVLEDLQNHEKIDMRSVGGMASIDLKKDEPGLLRIQELYNWPLRFFTREQLDTIAVPSRSSIVHEKIGIFGVCEAAAVLAAASKNGHGRLLMKKRKWTRITAAVAETVF